MSPQQHFERYSKKLLGPSHLIELKGRLPLQVRKLLKNTEQLALLDRGFDHSWLKYENIIRARRYMGPINKGKIRKSDGAPECTHALEVTDEAVNTASKKLIKQYGKELIAYIAYLHDAFEDNPNMSIRKTVYETYKGSAKNKRIAIEALKLLTDSTGVPNEAKKEEQIMRANNEVSGLVAHIRCCDKTTRIRREIKVVLMGQKPFTKDLERNIEVVERITNVPKKLKEKYRREVKAFRKILAAFTNGAKRPNYPALYASYNFAPTVSGLN